MFFNFAVSYDPTSYKAAPVCNFLISNHLCLNLPNYDENLVGITNLAGLNIVNFEVFPHYEEAQYKSVLNKYQTTTKNEVKEITNDGYLVINL